MRALMLIIIMLMVGSILGILAIKPYIQGSGGHEQPPETIQQSMPK
ncbi:MULTISPECIES: hypothetical protein [unclassified Sinorhizobium]